MPRNLKANIEIGARLATGVAAAFGGLQSKLAGLKGSMKDLRQQSAMLAQMQKRQDALAGLKAQLAGFEKAGKSTAKLRDRIVEQEAALERLSGALRKAGVNTSNLAGEQSRLEQQMQRVVASESRFRRINDNMALLRTRAAAVGTAFGNVRASFGGLMSTMAGAGLGIGAAGYAFKTQFIDRAAAFEKYRIQLEAFGDDAEKALSWSEQFAMKTPLDLDQVVNAFVRLRQQGLDPTDGTLQALTDSVFKTGGSIYDLEEIINQLGQAFRKEKLTAEDVKPLINRGVPVYDMLAKAMGRMTKEIVKMQEEGKLGRDAIKGMLFEIGRWSQGTSERMAGSWTGILGRMSDYWVRFTKLTMESGPFTELKKQLESFLGTLERMDKEGTLKRWAEQTGAALVKFLRDTKSLASELRSFTTAIKDAAGGWKNLGIAIGGLALAPTIASVINLGASLGSLAWQVGRLLGPWGLLAGALAVTGAAFVANKQPIMRFIDDALAPLDDWLDGIIEKLTQLGRMLGMIPGYQTVTPGASLPMVPLPKPKASAFQAPNAPDKFGLSGILGTPMPSTTPRQSVTNNMEIKIDARGMNPEQMIQEIDRYRRTLPKTSLNDATGVLAPR